MSTMPKLDRDLDEWTSLYIVNRGCIELIIIWYCFDNLLYFKFIIQIYNKKLLSEIFIPYSFRKYEKEI